MTDPVPELALSPSKGLSKGPRSCRHCTHFDDDPARFEAAEKFEVRA